MDIPKYVEDNGVTKKVTMLGKNFCRSQSLDYVNIPDTVKALNDYAFYWSKVKSVHIPKSTVEFGDRLFVYSSNLENIDIDDDNPVVKDIDGVVYTKSGKTIIMCPPAKGGESFTINSDVEAIGRAAFAGTKFKNISISSSVKRIKYSAFCDSSIESINLPNTIQELRRLFL